MTELAAEIVDAIDLDPLLWTRKLNDGESEGERKELRGRVEGMEWKDDLNVKDGVVLRK